MVRIELESHTPGEVVLKVEGWIGAEDTPLLEQEFCRWGEEAQRLVLDLEGIRSLDQEGSVLLERWTAKGVVLRAKSSAVKGLLRTYGLGKGLE